MRLTPEQQGLVANNQSVVRWAVKRFYPKYHDTLSREEIGQVAQLGLINAAKNYDPTHLVPFFGFARRHVAGAVRRHAGYERRDRKVKDAVGHTTDGMVRKGSVLTDTPKTAKSELIEKAALAVVGGALGMFADDGDDGPEEVLVRRETAAGVHAAIAALTEEQRAVVQRVYFGQERTTLKDVAEALGWTVITTRRRHASAIGNLARILRPPVEAHALG